MIKVSEMVKEEYEKYVSDAYHLRQDQPEKAYLNVMWALNNLKFAKWGGKRAYDKLLELNRRTMEAFRWAEKEYAGPAPKKSEK